MQKMQMEMDFGVGNQIMATSLAYLHTCQYFGSIYILYILVITVLQVDFLVSIIRKMLLA